jgi:hypothetical protein
MESPSSGTINDITGLEHMNNPLYKPNTSFDLSFASLIAFIGGRHVISDFYDHRPDILCNPLVKIIILFSILYMNIKNVKLSILLFFIYIFFIDNYIADNCDKEYIDGTFLKGKGSIHKDGLPPKRTT